MGQCSTSGTKVFFLFTVVVSVDCLTALLKDNEDIQQLGILLGIQEGMMKAIQSYYGNDEKALINHHIISLWHLSCSQDPIRQLRDSLHELKKFKTSQQLLLLKYIGMYITIKSFVPINSVLRRFDHSSRMTCYF